MRYRVRLLSTRGPAGKGSAADASAAAALVVELPPLRAGDPAQASVDGRTVEVLLLPAVEGEPRLRIAGKLYSLRVLPPTEGGEDGAAGARGEPGALAGIEVSFLHRGWPIAALVESETDRLRAEARAVAPDLGPSTVSSPLPGVVRRILAKQGQSVAVDTPLFTLEAMKMENEVRAERRGRVAEIFVRAGQVVNAGDPLARIDPG